MRLAWLLVGFFGCAVEDVRPNIILVIADDQDISKLGFVGGSSVTPTIDRLAETGVVFSTAYTTPRCRPTLAGLLSGMTPIQNGIYTNVQDEQLIHEALLPQLLRDAGYATYAEGKFWEGDPRSAGFDFGPLRGAEDRFLNENQFVRESQEQLFHFLTDHREKPFFVWYAPLLPHAPLNPPADILEEVRGQRLFVPRSVPPEQRRDFQRDEILFTAMNSWLDRGVQLLLEQLKETQLDHNTLIVFLSDNGMVNGHASKGSPFDKAILTPLLFHWKDQLKPKNLDTALASYLDVMPTLLDYAGVPTPSHCLGRSLRPWLEGTAGETAPSKLFGASYTWADAGTDAADAAYAIYARSREWKYIRWLRDVREEDNDAVFHITHDYANFPERSEGSEGLYHLAKDPHERRNLANLAAHKEVLEEFRRDTRRWWDAQVRGSEEN